jgi:hypothetical protein
MCEAVLHRLSDGFDNLWDNVKNVTKRGAEEVAKAYNYLGVRVEKLAHDHLPPTAAKIVACIVWSLPYTLACAFLPGRAFEIITGIVIGIWETSAHDVDELIGQKNRGHLFTGIRNASAIQVVRDVVKLVATRKWGLLVPITLNLFAIIQCHFISRTPTPEKKEPAGNGLTPPSVPSTAAPTTAPDVSPAAAIPAPAMATAAQT